MFFIDQELLDEISDNEIEDIKDGKNESEDEIMVTDNEDIDEFGDEITEEQLAAIKVYSTFNLIYLNYSIYL